MSIDEAIERCETLATKGHIIFSRDPDIAEECNEKYKQLAEWLEELKDYRDKNKMVVRVDCENMDSIKDKIEELSRYAENQYNKAVDDFAEKFLLELSKSVIWSMLVNCHNDNNFNDTADKIVNYVADEVRNTAEQLKVGESE